MQTHVCLLLLPAAFFSNPAFVPLSRSFQSFASALVTSAFEAPFMVEATRLRLSSQKSYMKCANEMVTCLFGMDLG